MLFAVMTILWLMSVFVGSGWSAVVIITSDRSNSYPEPSRIDPVRILMGPTWAVDFS